MLGGLLILLAFAGWATPARAATIANHKQWLDTDGKPIDCHEGSLLRVGSTFYRGCRSRSALTHQRTGSVERSAPEAQALLPA